MENSTLPIRRARSEAVAPAVEAEGAGGALAETVLLGLAVVCFSLWLYFPFKKYFLAIDQDACLILGYIRMRGDFFGWPSGFPLQSALTRLMSGFFRICGGVPEDLLGCYQAGVILSAMGIVALGFTLLYALTRHRLIAAIFSLLLGLTPGLVHLISVYEDNVPASLMHMQLVCVFMAYVHLHRRRERIRRVWLALMNLLLPLSLFLALASHRQNLVTLAAPALLVVVLRDEPFRKRLRLACHIEGMAVTLLLLAFGYYTCHWSGGYHWRDHLNNLREWVVPNFIYKSFYFFNRYGWDFGRQGREILSGCSRILGDTPGDALPPFVLLLLLGILSFTRLSRPVACDDRLILLFFILIHVPHSLIYESGNLERWDVIIPPATVLLGVCVHRARMRWPAGWKRRAGHACLAALLVPLVLAYFHAYQINLERQKMLVRNGDLKPPRKVHQLRKKLFASQPGARAVVVYKLPLDRAFLPAWFMMAETDFNYKDSIFFWDSPKNIFTFELTMLDKPLNVPIEEFRRKVKGAEIFTAPSLMQDLKAVVPAARLHYYQ